ncbi:BPSL0067 family protein [Pseudobacteroides cellulosolvens]|uniref:BPSL0067 family protein n=1 Tax=Pseudobacteroides cellulosolvens ATCC 35603 = DSM 2933 TaxID=398512 RepID=A0A0L6JU17_9FIRM|nr:BPSL0067 family protein [Pseudobacteroides cellulosolvens]KNY29308.1 hypothetical protein Bccel_4582 [Pseudobacteroides cellulosolvens ATCC 35603 = DSM 2933]
MPYIYSSAESLVNHTKAGSGQCVALVQIYAGAPHGASENWKQGVKVRDNTDIAVGTAIATFIDGRYPNLRTGNHAALYLSQDNRGVWVVDQNIPKYNGKIGKRYIRFKGGVGSASNDGDQYYVIE